MATWNDVGKFTCGELKAFSWNDVKTLTYDELKKLPVEQLPDIAKIASDAPGVPDRIRDDLRNIICGIVASAAYDAAKSIDWQEVYIKFILFLQSFLD